MRSVGCLPLSAFSRMAERAASSSPSERKPRWTQALNRLDEPRRPTRASAEHQSVSVETGARKRARQPRNIVGQSTYKLTIKIGHRDYKTDYKIDNEFELTPSRLIRHCGDSKRACAMAQRSVSAPGPRALTASTESLGQEASWQGHAIVTPTYAVVLSRCH